MPSEPQLLDDIEAFYREYLRVEEHAYAVLAPWVLHCHAFAAFTRTPYLHVTSPAPECGKTTLLELTAMLVPKGMMADSLTPAVLGRYIETTRPVLLLDEIDQLMKGNKEMLAAAMAVINGGYKNTGRRIINELKGSKWALAELSTFCPKVLSGISNLPPATKGRCISIDMRRLGPNEQVADIDEYITEPVAKELYRRCEVWAKSNLQKLRAARPGVEWLRGRQREISRPLVAVVDSIGGNWPERLKSALVTAFTTAESQAESAKITLLFDIESVFTDEARDKIPTREMIEKLCQIETSPWCEWTNGRQITSHGLSKLLRDFHIAPRVLRAPGGSPFKGYAAEMFADAWTRYRSKASNRDEGV